MVVRTKWPWSKPRPREPQPDADKAAQAEPEASPYEPGSTFRPEPGEKVRAAHEKDAVSGTLYVLDLVRYEEDGSVAVVTDGETSWSVAASSLQPVESSG